MEERKGMDYSETIICSTIEKVGNDIMVGGKKFSEYKLFRGYEGTVITMVKNTNNLELIAEDKEKVKRWYGEVEGSKADEIADGKYVCQLVHKELFKFSRINMDKGFLILLEGNELRGIHREKEISVYEANEYLEKGWYGKDSPRMGRLSPGEFVWLMSENRRIKVVSKSYEYRKTLIGEGCLYERFYQLANLSFIPYRENVEQQNQYKKNYHELIESIYPISKHRIKRWLLTHPIIGWQQKALPPGYLEDRKSRLYNIWLCFLLAVPLVHQKTVACFLDSFYHDRVALSKWLHHLKLHNYSSLPVNIKSLLPKLTPNESSITQYLFCQNTKHLYQYTKLMYTWYKTQYSPI